MSNPQSYLVKHKRPYAQEGLTVLGEDDDRAELRRDRGPSTSLAKTTSLSAKKFNLEEKAQRDDAAFRAGLVNDDSLGQMRLQMRKQQPMDNGLYSLTQKYNPDNDPRETSRVMFGGQYRTTKPVEIHEILKQEMFRSDIKNDASHFERSRPGPTMYGVADRYVTLDSALKSHGSSNPANGYFSWAFMVQGVNRFQDQAIGISDRLESVTEIEISPFYIPTPQDNQYLTNPTGTNTALPVLTPNGGQPPAGVLSQIPYEGKVTIEIRELGRQFISDDQNVRHHFEFTSTQQANGTTLLTPDDGFNKFIFTDPISSIHGMSLSFRNPYNNISFLPDVFFTPAVSMIVGAGQLLTFQFNNHQLATNNLIFVRNVSTGNTTFDNYFNNVTLASGVVVGLGGLTANQFRLNSDVDTTPLGLAVGSTISAGSFYVIVAYRRIRIPLRIRCMVSRLTNYVTP